MPTACSDYVHITPTVQAKEVREDCLLVIGVAESADTADDIKVGDEGKEDERKGELLEMEAKKRESERDREKEGINC